VLGWDEWRKGQRYGTILCDLERRCVIDLLPDPSAGAFVWDRKRLTSAPSLPTKRSASRRFTIDLNTRVLEPLDNPFGPSLSPMVLWLVRGDAQHT
jgi:hypothetical protein